MAGGVARLPHGGCSGTQRPHQCPAFSAVNSGVSGCPRALRHQTHAQHLQCNSRRETIVYATEAKPRQLPALRAPLALQRWVRRRAPGSSSSPANDSPATRPSGQDSQLPLQHQEHHQEQQQPSRQGAATEGPFQSPVAAALAGVCALAVVVAVLWAGLAFKDDIKDLVVLFIGVIKEWGPLGYLAYAVVYTGLELLSVPTVPLAMAAGAAFGPASGTAVTALSGVTAATAAFLIARHAARDRVSQWAQGNTKFVAIDRAIAKDGFKFVVLLRISSLLPFAAANYLYGLTSVDLASYAAGTLLGNLPGTYAYVSAGALANAALLSGAGMGAGGEAGVAAWQVALGLAVALLAIAYVGHTAKQAIEQAERELEGHGVGLVEQGQEQGKEKRP